VTGPRIAILTTVFLTVVPVDIGAAADLPTLARDPYVGAIAVDAATGKVLFEDAADRPAYPASVVKLMNLLVVLERIEDGKIALDDRVVVTAEAARMGGSQVYLKEKEVFTVEDLIYALMIQSANDAAVALAVHVAGSRSAFVELMNERARALGMSSTHFASPHGLPPSRGQQADLTTARDVAVLARAVLAHRDSLRYSSTRVRNLRNGEFVMRTHNKLLLSFDGCDGLKTGYFRRAGYSVAATAALDGERVIVVVLGSTSSRVRDGRAADLLTRGFECLADSSETGDREVVGPPSPSH
jgi:D-alanyl-D-alanine carboxypeptidase (penicillin-binding protein 5/6)